MQVRRLEVKNFRGIKFLEWDPASKLNCLVGPGDSGKTTVLDAIELALCPRQEPNLTDLDFFGLDSSLDIDIKVTVTGLTDLLLDINSFGLYLRGWHPTEGLVDEPDTDCEKALTVRFTLEHSLEPGWTVYTDRASKDLSYYFRRKFGVNRVGRGSSWHLGWSRGSGLFRATAGIRDGGPALLEALRSFRKGFSRHAVPELLAETERVAELATEHGAQLSNGLSPGLSEALASMSSSALSLQDGSTPLSRSGRGTQRLTAIAIQQLAFPEGAIVLVDEVETGLEPHRLRHLLRLLRNTEKVGQLIMTSHSRVAVEELRAKELSITRKTSEGVRIRNATDELQGVLRSAPEAFLSRRVVVCEGPTEVGLCRGLDSYWAKPEGRTPLACVGAHPIDGGGTNFPQRAMALAELGYEVSVLADSDRKVPVDELKAAGVFTVLWAEDSSTEERLFKDLPLSSVDSLLDIAANYLGREAIRDAVKAAGEINLPTSLHVEECLGSDVTETSVRNVLGEVSKKKGWFKRIDLGERVGSVVAKALSGIPDSDLALKLGRLGDWVHGH